jgi:hypothetical protein
MNIKHKFNMPMKTNTPPNPETQARIHQLKLSVDWHVEQFRVVRMCDGQSPQPAQRFSDPALPRAKGSLSAVPPLLNAPRV